VDVVALVISVLSLAVAAGGLVWNELRWRAERKSDVRVLASHDGMGVDIYAAETVKVEHVIALSVFNHGERPEHVMWTGLESLTGDPLADDRPKTPKIVDEPPPEARELAPRGQIAAKFKLPEAAIADGFVGYAVLGTGEHVYSVPAKPDLGIGAIQSDIREVIGGHQGDDETPTSPPG
jgi:hypothetical protein